MQLANKKTVVFKKKLQEKNSLKKTQCFFKYLFKRDYKLTVAYIGSYRCYRSVEIFF